MIVVSLTSEVFYPALPGGFAQFYRYGPGLLERGIQLRIHTPPNDDDPDERELRVNEIEVIRNPTSEGASHIRQREELVAHALQRMKSDPAGTRHCLQPNVLSWDATKLCWKARRDGVPAVFYSMMFPDPAPTELLQKVRHQLRWCVYRSSLTKMLVCSKRMRAAYHDVGGLPVNRMPVLPNGVDLNRFSPKSGRAESRRKLKLPEGAPIVVTCGSVVPRKGTDVLLEAWEKVTDVLPEARLVICGSIGMRPSFRDEQMRRDLIEFTEKIERRVAGDSSIILPGEVDDVAEYHQAADLFVFPSKREGLPNAVLEAMSSGLPCVIAPFAGIPDDGEEFGFSGQHFVRSRHDPMVLADDLIALLKSPDKRNALGDAARHLMEQTQSMEHALDTLADVYREISS